MYGNKTVLGNGHKYPYGMAGFSLINLKVWHSQLAAE